MNKIVDALKTFYRCMTSPCYRFQDAKEVMQIAANYGHHSRMHSCPICTFWHVEDRKP